MPSGKSTLKEFLEGHAPGHWEHIEDLFGHSKKRVGATGGFVTPEITIKTINSPSLELYCSNEACEGNRFFSLIDTRQELVDSVPTNLFLVYRCDNCKTLTKTFAVQVIAGEYGEGEIFKYAEHPPFGPHPPAKLLRLIQPDIELLKKGLRTENQGMGIGAFAYYRRVIENQRDLIFNELIRVIEKINPGNPVIEELKQAKKEISFTKAVDVIKGTLPESLFINGQNPLTLLHDALSEGVHALTDEECLELATVIRLILVEFAVKLQSLLKENTELEQAVTLLNQRRNKQKDH